MIRKRNFESFIKRTGFERKPYQAECFEWCLKREAITAMGPGSTGPGSTGDNMGGGILALDMGLGKTLIMLALLECNFHRHTLLVLPAVLLNQWEQIIYKTFGHNPLVYHGSRSASKKMTLEEIKAYPIVLTTYGQISKPSPKQQLRGRKLSLLHELAWSRVICDEAHHVSHQNTNEYKGLVLLKTNILWLVTGTPIQNSVRELMNLCNLLKIPKFNPRDEVKYRAVLQTFVYYRTKADVDISLPALIEHGQFVKWSNAREENFAAHIHSLLPCCNIPLDHLAAEILATSEPRRLHMKYLSLARQSCIYLPMLGKQIQTYGKQQAAYDGKQQAAYDGIQHSTTKIDAVIATLLERRANGCGKIVFCHYYAEIDMFASLLQGIQVGKLDGRTSKADREALLDPTAPPVDILLAQIKMCREGLNLQEHYSEVYFPSPDFTPAVENQAIARCWRIGQKKPVHVFRYVMMEPTTSTVTGEAASEAAGTGTGTSTSTDTSASTSTDTSAGASEAAGTGTGTGRNAIPFSLDLYTEKLKRTKREIIEHMAEHAMD